MRKSTTITDFLIESLIVYIEKEIVAKFSIDSIINDFQDLKTRQLSLG